MRSPLGPTMAIVFLLLYDVRSSVLDVLKFFLIGQKFMKNLIS